MKLSFPIALLLITAGCKEPKSSQNNTTNRNKPVVLLDQYFNNEWKKDKAGMLNRYHYTWDDKNSSGFSILAEVFTNNGIETKVINDAPAANNLKGADIYIIVDPDTEKETAKPNYIQAKDIDAIKNWVHAGGVLVLMGNDSINSEFTHFNELAGVFGIRFNQDSRNRVQQNQYEQGAIIIPPNHFILGNVKKIFIKEYSSLSVQEPAEAILKNEEDNVMAFSKYGNGTVFAIGDPWLYNEYTDGKKLPAEYENPKAAGNLVQWLLKQVSKE